MDEFFTGNTLKEIIDSKIHRLTPLIKLGVSIEELKEMMKQAALELDFERAAMLRDRINTLNNHI